MGLLRPKAQEPKKHDSQYLWKALVLKNIVLLRPLTWNDKSAPVKTDVTIEDVVNKQKIVVRN